MTERRRSRRFRLGTLIPVLIQSTGRRKRGRLINLSEHGAFLAMRTDVAVGEEIGLSLKLPAQAGGTLPTRAVVIWRNTRLAPMVRSLPSGCGVLFADADVRHALGRALEVLKDMGLLSELPSRETFSKA